MRLGVAALFAVVAGAACGACESAPAATTAFFGPAIEPPRGLAKIHPGMSVAEAKRLVPQLHDTDRAGVRDEMVLDSDVRDVRLAVRVDGGAVSGIVATITGPNGRDLLTKAWGEPSMTHDALGAPETTWTSDVTGWRARLDCLERNCSLEFTPHHAISTEFFGAHVVPPGDLSKLRIGMKLADAKLAAPGPVSVPAGVPTGVAGIRSFVQFDDKLGTVRSIYVNLPPHIEDVVTEAWGPGTPATEPVGKAVMVWPDPETGWRATLRAALGEDHDLAFDNYLPASQLFGDQPDSLDGLREPVLGKTVDEVKHTYKDDVVQVGKDLVLSLPPTEWDRSSTKLTLGIVGGKVHELTFAIGWKAHPEARDTLLELFKHKWGEPKQIDEDGKPVLLFRDDDPRVEVREDVEHGAWRVEIK